jgi:hypothetical protein
MSYRYSNTEKWSDAWFANLKQIEMLLFVYLCDNCDIAGFIEVNLKRWSSDLGSSVETIQGAIKGLSRGIIESTDGECLFLRNFLKHQKNLPLNENNKAHIGILRRFDLYRHKFEFESITEFIEGASKGLQSPSGNGNGIGNGKEEDWRENFSVYLTECNEAYNRLTKDPEYIKEQEYFNPNVNVLKSIWKGYKNFWGTEIGWKHKKKGRTKTIDWKSTITNSITLPANKVYLTKEEQAK